VLNIGKKDEQGRQRRIEHRGRNLRASRTGGVALRAQAKAAGVNLTANTSRGARVSTSAGKGTQVALQNGRFILRGRYGSGPLRFNLSKSGVSLSAKTPVGSFNFTKPNRSSVKIAGIQLRGQKAAYLQAAYLAIGLFFQLAKLAVLALMVVAQLLLWALRALLQALAALPGGFRSLRRAVRNMAIRRRMRRERERLAQLPREDAENLVTGLTLAYAGWGRGCSAEACAAEEGFAAAARSVAAQLDSAFNGIPAGQRTIEAATAHFAEALRQQAEPGSLPEIVLTIDDFALVHGPRTRRQARLLEVIADFAGLRMEARQATASEGATGGVEEGNPEDNGERNPRRGEQAALDINTADADALVALPGISEVRARQIQANRPFTSLSDLESISGIGPATVQQLREAGVQCGPEAK